MGQDRDDSNAQQQHSRQNPLTEREHQVLLMAADGSSSGEIARSLGITKRTVTFHLSSTYRKLRSKNRKQAIEAARHLGLLEARK